MEGLKYIVNNIEINNDTIEFYKNYLIMNYFITPKYKYKKRNFLL